MPTSARALLLCLALLGCQARRAKTPDWVLSAPAATAVAISGRAAWVLEQPHYQAILERFPPAELALATFLRRTHINARQDMGRVTVYVSNPTPPAGPGAPAEFLIQMAGFRNPGKVQVAIADAFPSEGTLPMDNRDLPLFILMELPPYHLRAMADGEGRVWLGDLTSLARLGSGGPYTWRSLAASADWISDRATVRGFVRPQDLLQATSRKLPGELARALPPGIETLAWGLTPGVEADDLNGFELSLTGTAEAVQGTSSWLQRFVDTVMAVPGAPNQVPELLQEQHRIGLRCALTQAQVNVAMARLGQPSIPCH